MDAYRWRLFFVFFFLMALLAIPRFVNYYILHRRHYLKMDQEQEQREEMDRTVKLMEAMHKTNIPPGKILKVLDNSFDKIKKKTRV
jgi:hypothetical protein